MLCNAATLSAQHKFVEALAIGEEALSIRARLCKGSPEFQVTFKWLTDLYSTVHGGLSRGVCAPWA
jgi:hypothetical protein